MWCQCYWCEHLVLQFQFHFLLSYPNFQVLGFNGGATAVDGDATGNDDIRSGRGLHGSLRHLPEPPRRLQLGDGILCSQTPRLFRFHLATLLQVTMPSFTFPFFQLSSILLPVRILLLKYWNEMECRSEQWHQQFPSHSSGNGAREVYLARYAALRQFKFLDPFLLEFREQAKPCNHLLLRKNSLFFSQVSSCIKIDFECID